MRMRYEPFKAAIGGGLLFALIILPSGPAVRGQEGPVREPDIEHEILTQFHLGYLRYLEGIPQGEVNEKKLLEALEHFSRLLASSPRDGNALLFQALIHGRLALMNESRAWERERVLSADEQSKQYHGQGALSARFRSDVDQLLERLAKELVEETDPIQRGLKENWRERWEIVRRPSSLSETQVEAGRAEMLRLRTAQREHYLKMQERLTALRTVEAWPSSVHLLSAVCLTKLARLNEDEAVAQMESRHPRPIALINAVAGQLDEAAAELAAYLEKSDVRGLDRLRAEFFTSVIKYRRAIPKWTRLGREWKVSIDLLEEARVELRRLSERIPGLIVSGDEIEIEVRRWQSYVELYLGLIAVQLAKEAADESLRRQIVQEARDHLWNAVKLDIEPKALARATAGEETDLPSLSRFAIRAIVTEHWFILDQLERGRPGRRQPVEDIELSLTFDSHYDSNVVLLGERTDLPRDVADESDIGFRAGTAVTYELDLDKYADARWERWTLGAQFRVNQLWHLDVDEFDEENYGTSLALRYALKRDADPNESLGRAYLTFQYDFDYFLLGRDKFLDAHQISALARFYGQADGQERSWTDLSVAHAFRDYSEPLYDRRLNRDGTYTRAAVQHSLKLIDMKEVYQTRGLAAWGADQNIALAQTDPDFPHRFLIARGGAQYGWDATAGDDFDLKSYSVFFGLDLPLPQGWTLTGNTGFEWQEYAQGSTIDFHRRPRRDFIQRYTLALRRLFVLRAGEEANRFETTMDRTTMALELGALWTLDDSNVVDRLGQTVFEYDRVVYGVTVHFSFN